LSSVGSNRSQVSSDSRAFSLAHRVGKGSTPITVGPSVSSVNGFSVADNGETHALPCQFQIAHIQLVKGHAAPMIDACLWREGRRLVVVLHSKRRCRLEQCGHFTFEDRLLISRCKDLDVGPVVVVNRI
jgi:hypothetical protein